MISQVRRTHKQVRRRGAHLFVLWIPTDQTNKHSPHSHPARAAGPSIHLPPSACWLNSPPPAWPSPSELPPALSGAQPGRPPQPRPRLVEQRPNESWPRRPGLAPLHADTHLQVGCRASARTLRAQPNIVELALRLDVCRCGWLFFTSFVMR